MPGLTVQGDDDLRAHILLRLQRLCKVPDHAEVAQAAKDALVHALGHVDAGGWSCIAVGGAAARTTVAGRASHEPPFHLHNSHSSAPLALALTRGRRCSLSLLPADRVFSAPAATTAAATTAASKITCVHVDSPSAFLERLVDKTCISGGPSAVDAIHPLPTFYEKYDVGTGPLYGWSIADDSKGLIGAAMAMVRSRVPIDARERACLLRSHTAPARASTSH